MNSNNTKEKIIHLTITEISNNSWENFSLRQVLRKLGLTTGAFYKYFESKDDLFKIISIEISQNIYQTILPTVRQQNSPQEQLLQLGKQLLFYFEKQPNLINFLFFNPSINSLYQATNPEQEHFQLYNLTVTIINNLLPQKTPAQRQEFLIKIWSFIQGYGFLIKNKVVAFDSELLKQTLNQLLGE